MLQSAAGLLREYKREREILLDKIRLQLLNDPRITSAWLAGSLGRGQGDELSDLDLWVAVKNEYISELVKARRQYAAQVSQLILFVEAPQNAPAGGGYLAAAYDAPTAPHLVDWYWLPDTAAPPSVPVKLLFDRSESDIQPKPVPFMGEAVAHQPQDLAAHTVSFFWMMLLITAKHIARQSPMVDELAGITLSAFRQAADFINAMNGTGDFTVPDFMDPKDVRGRLQFFRRLAVEMQAMMAKASATSFSTPENVVPGAFRYLEMVEKSIT